MLLSAPNRDTPSSPLIVTLLLMILVLANPRTAYCGAVREAHGCRRKDHPAFQIIQPRLPPASRAWVTRRLLTEGRWQVGSNRS